jgi:nitrogen fixation/metabolism regulation signal transduction histidine kinase
MVGAGNAGLNLAVIFHEVERGVDALDESAKRNEDIKSLRKHIEHIQALLRAFAPLLKKNPVKSVFASEIVEAAVEMRQHRFKLHNIICSAPILTKEEPDFKVKVPANLVVGALGNLLDNSIYWTQFRRERDESKEPAGIRVVTHWDEDSQSGLIAVVDNGPGFSIPAEKAVEPFITRRPEGMGLGLYFASLVMEQCGGMLTIHDMEEFRDEIKIPKAYDGAAVVLRVGESS